MQKAANLRDYLAARVTGLKKHPEKFHVFIEKGSKAADGKFINADGGATSGLLVNHLLICLITIALSVVATVIIAFIVKAVIGLRASEEKETQGLDVSEHGEEGYHGA